MFKLLIVDDEAIERQALQHFAENSGLNIISIDTAANAKEALFKVEWFKPDIILLDIKMPGMSGIEACEEIKKIHSDCKIIFLTAYNYFEYAVSAIKVGAFDFLIKPASAGMVETVLSKAITSINEDLKIRMKNNQISSKLEYMSKYLKSNLLYSILSGYMDKEKVEAYLTLLDMSFSGALFAMVGVNVNCDDSSQPGILKDEIVELIRKEVLEYNLDCITEVKDNYIYVLVMFKTETKDETANKTACEILSKIKKSVTQNRGVNIKIGIGHYFSQVDQANLSFFQAKYMLDNEINSNVEKSLSCENECCVDEILTREESCLIQKILSNDLEGAIKCLKNYICMAGNLYGEMERIRRTVYNLVIYINKRVIKEYNLSEQSTDAVLLHLLNLRSMDELSSILVPMINKIISEMREVETDYFKSKVQAICDYIDIHYDKKITLEKVAEMAGYSKHYFSRLFRINKGINFVDYLICLRIKKAKEMLSQGKYSIKEISNMIGYEDSNYFSSMFKKIEGISPTEYKKGTSSS